MSRITLSATFASLQAAATAVAAIAAAGVVPAAMEFLDAGAIAAVRRAGGADPGGEAAALLIVEVEGDRDRAATEAEACRAAMAAGAAQVQQAADAAEAERLWRTRKAVSAAVAKVMIGKVNEDVVVPRDRVAELVATTYELGAAHDLPVVNFGHLGDGNVHATFLIDPRLEGERARGDAAAAQLFETVLGMGGSLSGEHGVGQIKLPYVERQVGPGTVELMRRIRESFDPRGILNPGKKVPPRELVFATEAEESALVTVH